MACCLWLCVLPTHMSVVGFRYEEKNVRCLDSIRKYSADVPTFLHNRPAFFVRHCISRIPPACSDVTPASISQLEDGAYLVKSSTAQHQGYTVRLNSSRDSSIPYCQCPDWRRHCLPCKHLLGVVMLSTQDGWNSLPEPYRLLPQFNLDPDILPSTREQTSPPPAASPPPVASAAASPPASDQDDSAPLDSECRPTPDTAVHRLQSSLRQTLAVLMNCTYSITDANFLTTSLEFYKSQVPLFKARADRAHVRQQFRVGRRLVKSSVVASGLRRRLAAVRAKRRAQKVKRNAKKWPQSRHSAGKTFWQIMDRPQNIGGRSFLTTMLGLLICNYIFTNVITLA